MSVQHSECFSRMGTERDEFHGRASNSKRSRTKFLLTFWVGVEGLGEGVPGKGEEGRALLGEMVSKQWESQEQLVWVTWGEVRRAK